jgi:hypothetical protein
MESCKLFTQAALKLRSSQSQAPQIAKITSMSHQHPAYGTLIGRVNSLYKAPDTFFFCLLFKTVLFIMKQNQIPRNTQTVSFLISMKYWGFFVFPSDYKDSI